MKCLERMLFKLAAIFVIACCGCRTTHSATSETHLSEATESHSEGGTVVTTTTTQGPETITTVTEEFAPSVVDSVRTGGIRAEQGQRGREEDPSPSRTTRAPPSLVKRTTVTDVRGPSLSESHSDAHTASETHSEAKLDAKGQTTSTMKPVGLLGSLLGLWPLWVIGGLVAAVLVGWGILKRKAKAAEEAAKALLP